MRPGDFYEDDEPVADVVAAFEAGESVITECPHGQTWFLDANLKPRRLSTSGAPFTVALRKT